MAGPRPGEVLNDRYELIDRIGGGSMGEVWRSRDLVLGRTVAVKIVLPALLDAPTFRARFVAEARVMAMMDHPGIVRVYDYGYTDATDADTPGAAFLVMEFIEGESLDRVLARTGALEPRFAMKVLASLLDALGAVHRTGVVHRDVKPANVMLTSGGVVLADFGIARSPESLGLTAADALMGTVPYLAPELFHAKTPTPAADVYAVGILGYELLSGRQPFQAASTAAVMYMHMHEPPPPLPDYVATPAAEVLWQALEKDPGNRWADGAEMAEAVRRVLAGPVEVGEDMAAGPDPGGRYGGYAGIPSGYEDTLTDSGGRRRRRPVGEGGYAAAGGAAAAAGFTDAWHGRADYEDEYPGSTAAGGYGTHAGPLEQTAELNAMPEVGGRRGRPDSPDATRLYDERMVPMPDSDSGGRRGRAADYSDGTRVYDGVSAPMSDSDSAGRRSRVADYSDGTRVYDYDGVSAPMADSDSGGRRGRGADYSDGTRVYDAVSAPMPDSDSGGRRGRGADYSDGTRVYDPVPAPMSDSDSGNSHGRHAGHAGHASHAGRGYGDAEPPVRRRAAERAHGAAGGFGGRSGGLRADVRRKALIAAAVALPAMLGLSVALAMSSSGKSPDGGPAPGPAQQSDAPSTGSTDDPVPPTEPVPTSTSLYEHTGYPHHTYTSYPTSGRTPGSGSSSSATDPTSTGSRPGEPTGSGSTASSSSPGGGLTSSSSTTQGTTTPPSSASSHPSSTPS